MTARPIDKMVDWLEKIYQKLDDKTPLRDGMELMAARALNKARQLAAETPVEDYPDTVVREKSTIYDMNKTCPHCGGDPKIANPTGNCSHIHYPEAVNKSLKPTEQNHTAFVEELRRLLARGYTYGLADTVYKQGCNDEFDKMEKIIKNIISRHTGGKV